MIKVSEYKFIFCFKVYEKCLVEVKSIGGDWIFLGSSFKVILDIQNGVKGNIIVNFICILMIKLDDFDICYGDGQIVVKNKIMFDMDMILLVNCYIYVDDGVINVFVLIGLVQIVVINLQDVIVLGGSRNIIFDLWEFWIYSDLRWNLLI